MSEENQVTFEVNAGKYENWEGQLERNYKYCATFPDYEEALNAYNSCAGYAFRELILNQNNKDFIIKE